jgi:hypothetical protein
MPVVHYLRPHANQELSGYIGAQVFTAVKKLSRIAVASDSLSLYLLAAADKTHRVTEGL